MAGTAGATDLRLRRRLADDPGDPQAVADAVRTATDDASVFRWFRRLMALPATVGGDLLRKALLAARSVPESVLRDWVRALRPRDRRVVPVVAAALLLRRRSEPAAPAQRYMRAPDNFERILALLSSRTLPESVEEAYEIAVAKQAIVDTLIRSGFVRESDRFLGNLAGHLANCRFNYNRSGSRTFTSHWTFAIGHMVVLACLVRGQEAGVLDFRGVKVWDAPRANDALFDMIRGLSDRFEIAERWSEFPENFSSSSLEPVDGRLVDSLALCGIVADRAGSADGALFERPAPSHPALARYFDAVGIREGERIVTVHCRESGFRNRNPDDLRSVDVATMLSAIGALVRRGYRVIRLGDASMRPLPTIKGVVDYARSPLKTAELDVLLTGIADFHIGTSSGLSLVPLLFATPCLFLNWHPINLLPWGRRNWTVVKPIVASADGRRVVDGAAYGYLGRIREIPLLNSLGYEAVDLRADEVERTVEAFVATITERRAEPDRAGGNIGRVLVADDDGTLSELRLPHSPGRESGNMPS